LAFAVLSIGGDSMWVGVVLACDIGSKAALLPIGGVITDRIERRRLVVAGYLVQGCASAALGGWLALTPDRMEPWHFAVAGLARGVAGSVSQPALQGMLVDLAPRSALQSANATLRLVLNLARVALPGAGASLGAILGIGPVLVAAGSAQCLAAAVMVGVRARRRSPSGTRTHPLRDARDGWAAFTARPWLWSYVVVGALVVPAWLAGYQVLGPLQVSSRPDGVAAWGWVVSAFAAGMVAGSLLALRWRPRRLLVATVLVQLLWPVPLALLAGDAPLAVLLAAMVASGLALDVSIVLWETAKQQHVPPQLIGRVSSLQTLGELALVPLGYLLGGAVAAHLGSRPVMWGCYAVITVLTLALLAVPSVRSLTRVTEPEPVVTAA
jgi:MFS family permease